MEFDCISICIILKLDNNVRMEPCCQKSFIDPSYQRTLDPTPDGPRPEVPLPTRLLKNFPIDCNALATLQAS